LLDDMRMRLFMLITCSRYPVINKVPLSCLRAPVVVNRAIADLMRTERGSPLTAYGIAVQ
jgi:hypothetical protein